VLNAPCAVILAGKAWMVLQACHARSYALERPAPQHPPACGQHGITDPRCVRTLSRWDQPGSPGKPCTIRCMSESGAKSSRRNRRFPPRHIRRCAPRSLWSQARQVTVKLPPVCTGRRIHQSGEGSAQMSRPVRTWCCLWRAPASPALEWDIRQGQLGQQIAMGQRTPEPSPVSLVTCVSPAS
jgi:hypothetical protein